MSPPAAAVGEPSSAPLLTAVRLHSDEGFSATVVHGQPDRGIANVALFSPGRLVAYMLATPIWTRVYVFRTLAKPGATHSRIPGVAPRVDLLLDTRTRAAAARIRNMFRYFARNGRPPESLSETFWLRLGVLLGGRLRRGPHLPSLLRHEDRA
jgi:hypothetical protein